MKPGYLFYYHKQKTCAVAVLGFTSGNTLLKLQFETKYVTTISLRDSVASVLVLFGNPQSLYLATVHYGFIFEISSSISLLLHDVKGDKYCFVF